MTDKAPKGPYVYQPYGTGWNPERTKAGRLYAIGGLPPFAVVDGLTRVEAEALLETLNHFEKARQEGTP